MERCDGNIYKYTKIADSKHEHLWELRGIALILFLIVTQLLKLLFLYKLKGREYVW